MIVKAFFLLVYLWALVIRHTESACSTPLGSSGAVTTNNIQASSEVGSNPSSQVFANGWCASSRQQGDKWIEFDLGASGMGIGGVILSPLISKPTNYFKNVLVQYVPIGSSKLQDFPFKEGKFEVKADKPTTQNVTIIGLPAKKLRFILKSWNGDPCLQIDFRGCTITELCGGDCQNNGTCMQENYCYCQGGYRGYHCEIEPCVPVEIPIHADMVRVSSEDNYYTKDQLPEGGSNRGWCPAMSDNSPAVEIKLSKPTAVSVFNFYYKDMDAKHTEKEFMRDFELQYIAPTDSSKIFRTFAPSIPALNGSHFFMVTTQPTVVTDRLRIVPANVEKRACFKVRIKGCNPRGLCTTGFCKNGGSCVGDSLCMCPAGFYGDSCQITKTGITNYNLGFTKIENKILHTTSISFTVTGIVTLTLLNKVNVLAIKGSGSFITLDKSKIPSTCFADIDHCSTGFTIGFNIKFGSLLDNTYLLSSGGNLPGHRGIALYFQQNQLFYIVSTSTKVWTLTVKYQPVINKWQHFEVTWNANLGIGLYLDGHLLGTFGRPVSRPAATQTLGLCIGCSHTTNQVVVDMLIKEIQTWALDRTNLVNARVVPAITTVAPQTTALVTTASTTQPTSTTMISTVTSTTKACVPVEIPIVTDMLKVSSEDIYYTKDQLPKAGSNRGWCPVVTDKSPIIEIKLDKPTAVNILNFYYNDRDAQHSEKEFMRDFELQYIAPTDSSKILRTFAPSIPALNGSHFFMVSTQPTLVTDRLRIVPLNVEKRACFKLGLKGCNPKDLCTAGFCLNGGSCVGDNLCMCPSGFYGDSCQVTNTSITKYNLAFSKIENKILHTASVSFTITGTVNLQLEKNINVLSVKGPGSYITLDKSKISSSCLADIEHCSTGFTIGLFVKFISLIDNTYIFSSGGNLPGHKGIALYFHQNQLIYIVSTSTKVWTLTVKYQPVMNKWQHFEVSWNANLGIGLYLDGHLLGTFGRPVSRPAATQTLGLCIGCSHTTNQVVVDMLIKEIQTWALDRTNLVNARVVPAITTVAPQTTALVTTASTTQPTSTTMISTVTSTTKACVPVEIPIVTDMLKVSSEDIYYTKDQLPKVGSNRGWCPAVSDKSPIIEIKLDKPAAVNVLNFYYKDMDAQHTEKEFMRDFKLQYIAPTDSSKILRTFAPSIPALNGSHFFTVSTQPTLVTDRLRIVPLNVEKRACFKLGIKGCNPRDLCTAGFCQNGGSCVGDSLCMCPSGFYGDSCQVTNTSITKYNLAFSKIENKILHTASVSFTITGTVTLQLEKNINVLSVKGPGSYITLEKSKIPSSCFADIEHCSTGFTIGLFVKFISLIDNTYIFSSGGNLPGHRGIALYFHQNQLIYIVSTSTKVWTLTVKYQPVMNKWQHFEVSWNANLGVGLYLDGHLLGTFGRPVNRPAATQTLGLCIGCSHTTNQVVVDMLIKEIQTWALDRTNLVNARVVPAVTTVAPQTTTLVTTVPTAQSTSSNTKLATTTASTATKTATRPKTSSSISVMMTPPTASTTKVVTTKPPLFQEYNLTFQTIIGNLLITPTFNFTIHGNPVLNLQEKGQTALVLNGSKQYIELPDKGIPCLEKLSDCKNGYTMKLEVKFTHIDNTKKTYILSSGGDVSGSSGTALYMQSNQLIFAVKQGTLHWVGTCNIKSLLQINVWYSIQVSWSMNGIVVIINGQQVISQKVGKPYPGTSVTHPVLIGKTTGSNYTAYMMVRNLFTWTASREVLVSHGVIAALTTPTSPDTSTTSSTTATTVSTTPETTQTTTTIPTTTTTTEPPIVEYLWNFTNKIHMNSTIYGQTSIKEGGMFFHNSSQFIDFGSKIECLTSPDKCLEGLTIQFTIQFKKLEENTYLLTSGGETPNGVGLAVVYRYGRLHFILSTSTHSWFASCGRDKLLHSGYHMIMISWHHTTGLFIYIDNYLVDSSKVPLPHETTVTTVSTVYFGKPHFSVSVVVKIEYLVQTVHIWYARLEILIQKGICKPPSHGTTPTSTVTTRKTTRPTSASTTKQTPRPTAAPTTKKTTRPATQTPRVTFSSSITPTVVQQCPAGCVSIGSSLVTEASSPQTSLQTRPTTSRPKPSATPSSQYPMTPPAPDTASPVVATTARTIPDYHEIPKIQPLVGKDKNAYLACTFKGAIETGVVLTVSLLIQGKVVFTTTVPGNTGIALFSVAKIDDNLHKKQVRCSLKASYSGSTLTSVTTYSSIFIPQFLVTPNRLTVTEGHSAEHVTVTSTAPPHFYCCKGCKGSCQVHIVTSWSYDRHDLKCDKKVIAQAVIGGTKPKTYNKYICGFALTIDNWNQGTMIPVKATIDRRRDGDHKNSLNIKANVYNQPVGVSITVQPAFSFHIHTVEVLIKDNDHSTATCKSVNDPHMTTFDGQRYDNMHEGQFVLYRHKTLPFEVRADYERCRPKSRAYCNCAVAVKSGDDVITVTGCQTKGSHGIGQIMQHLFGHHNDHGHGHGHGHDKTPMTIQMYINGRLTPGTFVRRYGCGQKYEIELPTGTVITVQQSYKPFINIWVKASSADWQQTEGLCGSYDGHRSNDLKLSSCRTSCVSQFIAHWKVNTHFFFGVGVSSKVTGDMYCSCVEGKESVCSPGLGVMKCSKSRYDVTSVLVQQAKKPVLGHRIKRQAEPVPTATAAAPLLLDSGVTIEEATEFCQNAIMNSTVTQSCSPIITSNVTERIDDCAKDYNATGMTEWAIDHIRDIAFDCVNAVEALVDANNGTDSTNNTSGLDILGLLASTCVDDCEHGSCTNGICECEVGYSGETCNISSSTKPVISSVPYYCDISLTVDCKLAMIFGTNFVKSDHLTCHFDLVEVTSTVSNTGTSSTSKAIFISLYQVGCVLPSQHSASIRISNDGTALSDSSTPYVVYSSVCHDCYTQNSTDVPTCNRKPNNCIINGVCYGSHETSSDNSCEICLPGHNNGSWSVNNVAECVGVPLRQKDDDDMSRTQIIILAVVCAVFGALIIFGLIYICRQQAKSGRKKAYEEYDVVSQQNARKDVDTSAAIDNPAYNYRF